jgi:hypothetical protein
MKRKIIERSWNRLLFVALLVLIHPGDGLAYVMPAEQIVEFMVKNLSRFKTLVIKQQVIYKVEDQEKETAVEEKVWLSRPDRFYSQILRQPDMPEEAGTRPVSVSLNVQGVPRRLLMSGEPKAALSLLSRLGVDLETVGLTRLDGVIAYRIGEKGDYPKLLVDKERFLPLSLSFAPSAAVPGAELETVRFDDYRKVREGWYPFQISFWEGEEMVERDVIVDLQVDVPIEISRLRPFGEVVSPPPEPSSR